MNDKATALANLYNIGAQLQSPGVQTFDYEEAWLSEPARTAMNMYESNQYINLKYNDLIKMLNAFLAKLSQNKRKIFLERYWYLYSIKEISSNNKISESNTKAILMRIRNQLKDYLKEGALYE